MSVCGVEEGFRPATKTTNRLNVSLKRLNAALKFVGVFPILKVVSAGFMFLIREGLIPQYRRIKPLSQATQSS